MRKYLPPPHKFRPKTLDSTDTVDFTHFRRTVNRYCDYTPIQTGFGVVAKMHEYLTDVCYKLVIFQNIADFKYSNNETTNDFNK